MGYKQLYDRVVLLNNNLISELESLKTTNAILLESKTNSDYRMFLHAEDCIQCSNRYEWKGLPINLTSQQLEALLYQHGSLCMFENERGELIFSLYSTTGRLNEYGILDEITPISLDGKTHHKKRSVILYSNAKPNNNGDYAVILNDYTDLTPVTPIKSRMAINRCATIEAETKAHLQLMCNLDVSIKKALALCETEEQKRIVEKQLQHFLDPSQPIIAVSSKRNNKGQLELPIELHNIDSSIDISQYTNAIDYYSRTRRHFNGVPAPDTYAKKERLVTSETEDTNVHTNIMLLDGLIQRRNAIKLFTEYCKNKNNKNLSCNIAEHLRDNIELSYNNEILNDSGGNEDV